MAPTMVKAEDGHVIEDMLSDLDALDLARRVHAATGETLSLIPYVLKKGEYVLHEAEATVFPRPQAEPEPEAAPKKKAAKKPTKKKAA